MKKPMVVPYNSDWPMLHHSDLADVTFRHKLAQGNVDVTFGCLDEERKGESQNNLPDEVKLVEHSNTFSLRIFSGKVDRQSNFKDQVQVVENAMQAMTKLSKWILDNRHLFSTTND